jgi:hypothetical protein
MTRKHFQAFADKIQEEIEKLRQRGIDPGTNPAAFLHIKRAAEIFADVCLADNERFDYHRFMKACGIPDLDEQKALADLEDLINAKVA